MVRVTLLAVLMVLLAACGRKGDLAPFAESRIPPALSARFFPPEGWAWGFIQTGAQPMQRYGVAAPARVPLAVIVIVPGYGESAEVWFETAADLIGAGYTVWILDRAGQGGSERYAAPRDAGSVTSFGPDVANLRNLVRQVIRPEPATPVILIAHADGAVTALRALQTGLRVDGLIAASPALAARGRGDTARGVFGITPLARPQPWTRDSPDDHAAGLTHDPWRGQVRKAWQTANPDLRMAKAGTAWTSAYAAASRAAEAEASRIRTPILMLNPTAPERLVCSRAAACEARRINGARAALHLESDLWRQVFMQEVSAFAEAQVTKQRQLARTVKRDNIM